LFVFCQKGKEEEAKQKGFSAYVGYFWTFGSDRSSFSARFVTYMDEG